MKSTVAAAVDEVTGAAASAADAAATAANTAADSVVKASKDDSQPTVVQQVGSRVPAPVLVSEGNRAILENKTVHVHATCRAIVQDSRQTVQAAERTVRSNAARRC